jgi:hypothetical protein
MKVPKQATMVRATRIHVDKLSALVFRITHFRHLGAMAIDLGEQSGIDPEKIGEGPAGTLWALAAFKTIVEHWARGNCSPAQIAEAMGVPEAAVNEAWAGHLAQVGVPQLPRTGGSIRALAARLQ